VQCEKSEEGQKGTGLKALRSSVKPPLQKIK
jgi:hypothetical protein